MKDHADTTPITFEKIGQGNTKIAKLEKLEIRSHQTEKVINALLRIGDAVGSDSDMKTLYSVLHSITAKLMYAKNFYIAMYDKNTEMIHMQYFVDEFDSPERPPQKLEKGGVTSYVIRTGTPVLLGLPECKILEEKGEIILRGAITEDIHWLGVPLKANHQVLGMMAVQSYTKDVRYTEKDKELLIFVSQHIAAALQRKQAEKELKKAYDELERRVEKRTNALAQTNAELQLEIAERQTAEKVQEALFRIAKAAIFADGMKELYESLHGIVGELMYANNFYIAFYDKRTETINWPYYVDKYDSTPPTRKLKKGLTEYVLSTGEALLTTQVLFHQLIKKKKIEAFNNPPEYWLGVPLQKKQETFGVLAVQSYSKDVLYTEKDKELLNFVSQHIATALQRTHSVEALKNSEQKLKNLSNQMEQFSRTATSMLYTKETGNAFNQISKAIVEHSDYRRVIISLFKDRFPYRDIIGFGGVSDEIVNKLRAVEMSKNWYENVFRKGKKIGPLSYYIPHTMKHILNQKATVYGKGSVDNSHNSWHPEDNLFVVMNNEKGQLLGIISVDDSKSGLKPSEETVRPLEIFSSLISQIIISKKEQEERKKLEKQLVQAHKMESIGTLAGGIAHDFNNLLYIILGNIELALEEIPKLNQVYTNLEEVKSASIRASGIVKQLLNFSRKSDHELQPIGAITVIKDTLNFLRSTIPSTIEIRKHLPDEEITILGDSVQINQVFMNIITNAFQAMEDEIGILEIKVEKLSLMENNFMKPSLQPGEYLKISIRDTGSGIAPKDIDRIFDPYFTTKSIGQGSGMGLAVVHGIIKNHNGYIAVKNRPAGGAVFTLFFPVILEKPVFKSNELPSNLPLGAEKILLVDDEKPVIDMTKKVLEKLGYKVNAILNPEEAIELFMAHPNSFDLVITDMTMPQMTGAKLSEKLMAIRSDIPIIICTGHSSLIDENMAKEIGISAYLMKPASMSKLAKTIRAVLKLPL